MGKTSDDLLLRRDFFKAINVARIRPVSIFWILAAVPCVSLLLNFFAVSSAAVYEGKLVSSLALVIVYYIFGLEKVGLHT